MDTIIQVDQEKCIRCGLCASVCPTDVLTLQSHGPQDTGNHCIACGHCVAVCPREALNNVMAPLSNQVTLQTPAPVLDANTAATFLRARRSIRSYKQVAVQREKIKQLLNIARFAPTGGNTQGLTYHVIDNPHTLKDIIAATIDWMEAAIKTAATMPPYFAAVVNKYRQTGHDGILRGAPCLIVATAPKSMAARGRDNTHFSLAYAELYAPSIDLGTCWAGFFEACAISGYQPLLDILNLPANMNVTGGLMVGYPKYTYKRLVDRKPLQIIWQ